MTKRYAVFADAVQSLKRERRYREFVEIERDAAAPPCAVAKIGGARKSVTVWFSNDHLGMSRHPDVLSAARDAVLRSGIGAGGTRNISGNSSEIVALESELADLHQKEAALVFTSGYVANLAASSPFAPLPSATKSKPRRRSSRRAPFFLRSAGAARRANSGSQATIS